MTDADLVKAFWDRARTAVPGLPATLPGAWAFGATKQHADELLGLVLAGTKTGTASSLWDIEAESEPMPQLGEFSIILDGEGKPRVVIETYSLRMVPFNEVDAEHAYSEGEGDRSLEDWRAGHERFWRNHSVSPRGFAPDMPIIAERFRVIYQEEELT